MNQFEQYTEKLKKLHLTVDEKAFLDEVKTYVANNMVDGHLSIASIANGISIHESKMRRRISQITGLTPSTFLTVLRMQRAQQLLSKYPTTSIAHIAFECGYADHSHFTHTFHRLFSMSPSDYAKLLPAKKILSPKNSA